MQIIEYFGSDNKEYWLGKLGESDWGAGQWLCGLLKACELKKLVGEDARVLMLVDGEELVSFCTLAERDDIPNTALTPWVGFLYTFPQYRGRRCAGALLAHAEALARADGAESLYISTNHIGLYEKYGYSFLEIMKDVQGEGSRVYVRHL